MTGRALFGNKNRFRGSRRRQRIAGTICPNLSSLGAVHTCRRNKNTQQSPAILDSVWGRLGQGNHVIIMISWFSKSSISKMFFFHIIKRKAGGFKFLRFGERFRKAPFSWRISVDERNNAGRSLSASRLVLVGRFFAKGKRILLSKQSGWRSITWSKNNRLKATWILTGKLPSLTIAANLSQLLFFK